MHISIYQMINGRPSWLSLMASQHPIENILADCVGTAPYRIPAHPVYALQAWHWLPPGSVGIWSLHCRWPPQKLQNKVSSSCLIQWILLLKMLKLLKLLLNLVNQGTLPMNSAVLMWDGSRLSASTTHRSSPSATRNPSHLPLLSLVVSDASGPCRKDPLPKLNSSMGPTAVDCSCLFSTVSHKWSFSRSQTSRKVPHCKTSLSRKFNCHLIQLHTTSHSYFQIINHHNSCW